MKMAVNWPDFSLNGHLGRVKGQAINEWLLDTELWENSSLPEQPIFVFFNYPKMALHQPRVQGDSGTTTNAWNTRTTPLQQKPRSSDNKYFNLHVNRYHSITIFSTEFLFFSGFYSRFHGNNGY